MKTSDARFLTILNRPFKERDGKLYFIEPQDIKGYDPKFRSGINKVKSLLKRNPRLYEILHAALSPGLSCIKKLTSKQAIAKTVGLNNLADRIVISIGSGAKVIHHGVINLDIYAFRNVDLVADGRTLPFKDGSVDMVICESFLEHVPEPLRVIGEIRRVVKPGGYAYVSVPFVYPLHASPSDYFRWSKAGLKESLGAFLEIQSGMRAGPMAALQGVLMHLLALPLSLGIEPLYLFWSQLFMMVLAPIKILDIFFSFIPQAHEIAADVYFLGRRKAS